PSDRQGVTRAEVSFVSLLSMSGCNRAGPPFVLLAMPEKSFSDAITSVRVKQFIRRRGTRVKHTIGGPRGAALTLLVATALLAGCSRSAPATPAAATPAPEKQVQVKTAPVQR